MGCRKSTGELRSRGGREVERVGGHDTTAFFLAVRVLLAVLDFFSFTAEWILRGSTLDWVRGRSARRAQCTCTSRESAPNLKFLHRIHRSSFREYLGREGIIIW